MSRARARLARAYERALRLEKAGDPAAAAAWAEVLALDPADPGGAAMRLAALGAAPAPDRAAPAYVATLFDQHADTFETVLVDGLEYGAPPLLRERMQALGLGPFAAMLDLGCGTGLAAESLEDMTARRVGVDLAPGMIEACDGKDLYHDLYVGDAERFLAETEARFDLIVALDVLPYLGEVGPLLAAARACLAPGGLLALSTESLPEPAFAGRPYVVTKHQRFAHRDGDLRAALAAAGFALEDATEFMVRRELGAPIDGWLLLARAV